MATFLAPALMCFSAPSFEVKKPVDSTTTSIPNSPHGKTSGSLSAKTLMSLPLTTMLLSVKSMVPLNGP